MHKNGMLACIYAHLLSLRNLSRLTDQFDPAKAKAAGATATAEGSAAVN